jgi:mono/diheme cytochrome c family protein
VSRRVRLALPLAVGPILLVALLLRADPAAQAGSGGARAGDPARGAIVWASSGCGACHRLRSAGSTGKTGPDIDRWLVPHALRAKLSPGDFALSRVTWGGRGMQPYVNDLSVGEIEDVVSFVLGRPYSSPAAGVGPAPNFLVPPLVTAGPSTVARWIAVARLPASARRGATLFAREGCLSCHTYLGSGVRRYRAPDLTKEGTRGRTKAFLRSYVARAYLRGNTLMPMYADLGGTNLAALADFLAASKGRAR